MKVFISWSGTRSETLAKALREWFPLVLNYVEPWVSQSDIEAGERWGIEVAKELESSNFGVICVTRENLTSPWLLFESGALAKSMQDGRVIPLLLDLDFKEISGPLAQFQAKKAEQAGIKELILSLNKAASTPIPDQRLEKLFSALWGDLETNISAIPKGKATSKSTRPQGEILEELVSSIRGVEMRIRDTMDDDPSLRRPRRSRVDPMMLVHMARHLSDGRNDSTLILMLASLLREPAPWVYEIGRETYKAMNLGKKDIAEQAYRKFVASIEMLIDSPFGDELKVERKLLYMIREALREFDMNEYHVSGEIRRRVLRTTKPEVI